MSELRVDLYGDVQINRENPESAFKNVIETSAQADLRVCQLESTISDKGTVRTDVQNPFHRVPPRMTKGLDQGNIDAVTFAGNNNVDYGYDAMLDTSDRLSRNGIQTVGVGADLSAAREPLYLEDSSATLGIVNACSVLRSGYAATETTPGLSPLHVSTFYETLENVYEQPGTPARTVTVPNERDLLAVLDLIERAADAADYVLFAMHGGVHFTYDLAMYQPTVAYRAIEAGADAVVGTHPHNLQAIDIYQDKPIFYSLGNFVFDQPESAAPESVSTGYLQYYGMSTESGAQNYPHPRHTRDTMIVHLSLSEDEIDFSITPVRITEDANPTPVSPTDESGTRIHALLSALSEEIGVEVTVTDDQLVATRTSEIDTRLWVQDRMQSYPWLSKLQHGTYSDAPVHLRDFF